MNSPLYIISRWLEEESNRKNTFVRGAVLSTLSKDNIPSSRVVGTLLNDKKIPMFFTSSNSRKVEYIAYNNNVSLTYLFSNSVRSISIEGTLKNLTSEELESNWLEHDEEFRKNFILFADTSGDKIESLNHLQDRKNNSTLNHDKRPKTFTGYKFDIINRISFYSVQKNDFAKNDVYIYDTIKNKWNHKLLVP